MENADQAPTTRRGAVAGGTKVNVGKAERVASAIGGGALALYGLRRRDLPGAALAVIGGILAYRGTSGHCPVYGALDMSTADEGASWLTQQHGPAAVLDASRAVKIERSIRIDAAPDALYRFWRDFENLPQVMRHIESVQVLDARRSRWRAKAPAGQTIEWDAVVHNEIPGQLIAWKSVEGATVPNAGSVHFTPAADGGTVVKVVLEYQPPAGRMGQLFAQVFGREPELQVREDLGRFKRYAESGELAAR